jgi:nucleoside-diphosphate-sugar epimerase
MDDKLYIILGANGFVGSYLQSYFKSVNKAFKPLYKPLFNICDLSTYYQLPVDKELFIFDTITVNNQDKAEIENVNIHGQKSFIDWLNKNNIHYHYIYFSTLSTLKISEHPSNDYVVSKFIAENYVKDNCKSYTIIRLSFPFGKGENKNRLLTGIINNLRAGNDITIDNVFLNLTPIEELGIVLKNNEFLECREINFIDGVTYRLQDLVSIIIEKIKPPVSRINFTDRKIDLTFDQNFFTDGYTFKVREALEQMIEGA